MLGAIITLLTPSSASAYALEPKVRLRSVFQPSQPDAVLACPATKLPLSAVRSVIGTQARVARVSTDGVRYPTNVIYTDLLTSSGRTDGAVIGTDELIAELRDAFATRTKTQLFRSPLTAFLYERGWRDNFKRAGFPGIDAEFEEVSAFFAPAAGGVVVDMSCGSGLMTRRLAASGAYGRVLALDYSEAMLTETRRRIKEQKVEPEPELVRADVAALPLQSGSVDALHAGAAMHCWPRLDEGLQEIRRVLKPGGRFFATTFFQGAYGPGTRVVGDDTANSFRFFEDEAELERLLVAAGFPAEGVEVRREGRGCAIIRASLPAEGEAAAAGAPADEVEVQMEMAAEAKSQVDTEAEAEAEIEPPVAVLVEVVEAVEAEAPTPTDDDVIPGLWGDKD